MKNKNSSIHIDKKEIPINIQYQYNLDGLLTNIRIQIESVIMFLNKKINTFEELISYIQNDITTKIASVEMESENGKIR